MLTIGSVVCFAELTSIGFYIGFPVLWLLLYLLLIPCFTTRIPFLQSPVLILSYHEYFLFDITCSMSTSSCMFMLTTRFSMHDYDSVLSLHVCLSLLATWHSYHHSPGEFYLTPLDPHVQVMELGACGFPQLLIRVAQLKHGSPADRLEPYPSRPPVRLSSFPFVNSWAPLILFTLVHPFVFSQLRISVM